MKQQWPLPAKGSQGIKLEDENWEAGRDNISHSYHGKLFQDRDYNGLYVHAGKRKWQKRWQTLVRQ